MKQLSSRGIETLKLDVLSESSIADCVNKLSSLDNLVNNAGATFLMPVTDISISEAKRLFDLNVWSYIAMSQAFLPLLLTSSKGMIVNQTSIASATTLPFQSVYCASKAAIAMFSDAQRLELEPFGLAVVDLKTGVVRSNLIKNQTEARLASLPDGSIYEPARKVVEKALRQDEFAGKGLPAQEWAQMVTRELLRKNPPSVIWRGEQAWLARIATVFPFGMFDGMVKK